MNEIKIRQKPKWSQKGWSEFWRIHRKSGRPEIIKDLMRVGFSRKEAEQICKK